MSRDLTEAAAWAAAVTIPEDGDEADETSLASGFGALANRTSYLRAQLEGLDAADHDYSGDVLFSGAIRLAYGIEITYPAPVPRVQHVLVPARGDWVPATYLGTSHAMIATTVANARTVHQIELHNGAKITGMRARIQQAGAGTSPLTVSLWREAPADSSSLVLTAELLARVDTGNTVGVKTPLTTVHAEHPESPLAHVVDTVHNVYYLSVLASDTAAAGHDLLASVSIYYDEDRLVSY